jgi:hypothetical protein
MWVVRNGYPFLLKECMNNKIKEIATKTFENLKADPNKPEVWIDAYVTELSRKIVFECSDVLREKAKHETDPANQTLLKVAALDVLDHFGL